MRLALHIFGRMLGLGIVFWLLVQPGSSAEKPQAPPIPSVTSNIDLQMVRLYARAEGEWSQAQRSELAALLSASGDFLSAEWLDPTRAEASPETLDVLLVDGDWVRLESVLASRLRLNPENARVNLYLGLLREDASYLERATEGRDSYARLAAQILSLQAVSANTSLDTALRLIEAEEWAFAERFLNDYLAGEPLSALGFAYRGFVRDQLGRDGYEDIQQAIALDPALSLAYYMLGLHYRARDDLDRSLNAFSDAHLLESENPAYCAELAIAYQMNDEYALAEDWYSQAVRLAEDDPRFVRLKAAFYADTEYQLTTDALPFFEAVLEAEPDDSALQISWGRVLFHLTRFEESEAVLREVLGLEPNNLQAQYYLAETLERLARRGEALEIYFRLSQTDNPYRLQAQRGAARLSR